jgi:HAE1 family hydrophobic/amphiphilic exporter-1
MVKTFIRKGILTLCLNLSILLVGYYTLPYLSSEFIPSVEVPAVAVIFPTPLKPEKTVIEEIVKPVEQALFRTGDLKSIETRIMDEKAIMILFYKWKYSPETCLRKARQIVENIPQPKDALAPIFILHRPTNRPILRTVFYGDDVVKVTEFVKKMALDLERIPGISQVGISGGKPEKIIVNFDPKKMANFQVNYTDVIKTSRNAWSFRQFFKASPINHYVSFDLNTVEDLGLLTLNSKHSDKPILLRWLSDIKKEEAEPKVIFGKKKHAVILEIIKGAGADTLSIVSSATHKINEVMKTTSNIKSKIIYDEAEKIVESQGGVLQNFLIGVLLNSFILIAFLGSFVGVVVASVVFPTALLGTLFVQKYLGISLNLFSLNGFSLAVGMITDASTVVLESIARRFQKGEETFSACWRGTKDVSIGVLASTLTTAGVLIPIAMQKNISSKLFSDLSLTVVSTQLLCLIAVFSLVPWLCFKMFKKNEEPKGAVGYLYRRTSFIVTSMVKFAHWVQAKARSTMFNRVMIPGSVVIFSLGMMLFLPKTEFLPAISAPVYSLNYPIKKSVISSAGKKYRDKFAALLADKKDVIWSVSTYSGDNIEILFELKVAKPPKTLTSYFKDPEIDLNNINIKAVGPAGGGEQYGFDGKFYFPAHLSSAKKKEIISKFCNSDFIEYCTHGNLYKLHEIKLSPNNIISARMGSNTLESAAELVIPLRDLDLRASGNLLFDKPVILKSSHRSLFTNHPISLGKGTITILDNLFKSKVIQIDTQFARVNGKAYEPLFFRLKNVTVGQAVKFMSGLSEEITGDQDSVMGMGGLSTMKESFSSLTNALILSAFIIFLILAVQFQSPKQALIIMGTIPLTLGGAIFGLIVMQETVNASVMVGFILLIGIVVNNGIFLVEATNQMISMGQSMADAVTESVTERTRPILMTSFSTIFGMLPTILIGGEGSELYRGMAIVNVFGMVAGTFLSVVITPIMIEFLGGKK